MTDSAPKSKTAYNIRLIVLFMIIMSLGGYYAYDNGYLDVYFGEQTEKKVAGIPERFKKRQQEERANKLEEKRKQLAELEAKGLDVTDLPDEPAEQQPVEPAETASSTSEPEKQTEEPESPESTEPTLADLESPNTIEPPVVEQPEVVKTTAPETETTTPETTATEASPVVEQKPETTKPAPEIAEPEQESVSPVDSKPVTETAESTSLEPPLAVEPEEEAAVSAQPAVEMPDVEKLKEKLLTPSKNAGTVADPSKPSALQTLTNATVPRVEGATETVPLNAPVPAKVLRYAAQLMKHYDIDRSLRIEPAEYKLLPQNIGVADLNGDGNITLRELSQYLANYGQGRKIRLITPYAGEETTETASTSDSGEPLPEGEPTEEEVKSALELELERRRGLKYAVNTKRLPAGLPPWFLTRDKNGDGQLTLSEFAPMANKAAVEEFRKLDRNRDGLLTPREYVGGNRKSKTAEKPVAQ